MSMHIIFLKNHEHYAAKSSHVVARAVGRNLIDSGIAVPFTVYQKMAAKKAAERADAKAKADAEKKAKAEKLLKEKEAAEKEKAVSKQAKTRSKAVKK
jgi:hypothetical protein